MENTVVAVYEAEVMTLDAEERSMILAHREKKRKVDLIHEKFKEIQKLINEIDELGGRIQTKGNCVVCHSDSFAINTSYVKSGR